MPYFDDSYYDTAFFDAPAPLAPLGPLGLAAADYFDCDYFDPTYFDTPDCGGVVTTGGHHALRPRRLPDQAPLDEADELLAVF